MRRAGGGPGRDRRGLGGGRLRGAGAAVRIARAGAKPGWTVTLLFLVATAANFLMIPHPVWMIVAAVLAILAAGWLAVRLAVTGTVSRA